MIDLRIIRIVQTQNMQQIKPKYLQSQKKDLAGKLIIHINLKI